MIEYVDYFRCIHCLICYDVCPMDVFEKVGRMVRVSRPEDCMTCYLCELECPVPDAIYVGPFRSVQPVLPYGEYDTHFVGKTSAELKQQLLEKGIVKTKIPKLEL